MFEKSYELHNFKNPLVTALVLIGNLRQAKGDLERHTEVDHMANHRISGHPLYIIKGIG